MFSRILIREKGAQAGIPVTEKWSDANFIYRAKARYDKIVTFRKRTHVSTEKADRAAEPPYSPAGPLLRYLQCKQSLQNWFCTFRGWISFSKEKFRK